MDTCIYGKIDNKRKKSVKQNPQSGHFKEMSQRYETKSGQMRNLEL